MHLLNGRRRRLLPLFVLSLAALVSMAGCGGGSSEPDETSASIDTREAAQATAPPVVGGTFTRPVGAAPLFGMNIGAKHYDDPAYQEQLARLDVVILAFHLGWRGDTDGSTIRNAVVQLKARNPALKVGQYTNMNDSHDDPALTANDDVIAKVDAENWWLRDASGAKVQWTKGYSSWDVNSTEWTPPDLANNQRYPQWLARRNHDKFFRPVPEFDVWYLDNVWRQSRIREADWRREGVNVRSADSTVAAAFRRGHAAHWKEAAAVAPGRLLLANTDNDLSSPEYYRQLPAAFLEGLMGKSWSLEQVYGWPTMMQRYFTTYANLKSPKLLAFNVYGAPDDYRFFRYAFMSARLGNGHFSFTDIVAGHSSVPWFDEYEVAFGAAVDSPKLSAWSNGVYRRRFEKAMVLVNPNTDARTVTVPRGWRRLNAVQDPVTNNGAPARTITVPAKDGLVLVPA